MTTYMVTVDFLSKGSSKVSLSDDFMSWLIIIYQWWVGEHNIRFPNKNYKSIFNRRRRWNCQDIRIQVCSCIGLISVYLERIYYYTYTYVNFFPSSSPAVHHWWPLHEKTRLEIGHGVDRRIRESSILVVHYGRHDNINQRRMQEGSKTAKATKIIWYVPNVLTR